ncbi:MAG: hypothetical protein LBD73_01355 [Deferribacteraceae bacterium]|nr:hypothetical protein [Deferribacteraceae bacterium]
MGRVFLAASIETSGVGSAALPPLSDSGEAAEKLGEFSAALTACKSQSENYFFAAVL